MIDARLIAGPFDPAAGLAAFTAAAGDVGAVASFTGLARAKSKTGRPLTSLVLDHHPRLTETSLRDIARAGHARFGLGAVCVIHRHGAICPGEPIVFVAAAAAHRRPALEAVDYLMDRLKTDAIFWKREVAVDGAAWIEPTEADCAARARWEG